MGRITSQSRMSQKLCHLPHMNTNHSFGILNFGHWDLFEIWFLVLGIFVILIKQVATVYPVNYLCK